MSVLESRTCVSHCGYPYRTAGNSWVRPIGNSSKTLMYEGIGTPTSDLLCRRRYAQVLTRYSLLPDSINMGRAFCCFLYFKEF